MANVLTSLAADIYTAKDMVARELTGLITSATVNAGSEQAAVGQTVRSFATRTVTPATFTPSMTIPEGTDQTVDNKTLTLSTQKSVQIPWTGEDQLFVNGGNGFQTILGDQIKQAMRGLVNLIEVDAATEAYKNASRAYGTAGTTPFASNFNDLAELRKMMADNGAPVDDGQSTLVLNTAAGVKLRNLAQLQKANENGSAEMLRRGTLLDLQGFMLKESAGIQTATAGTGASYQLNGAVAVGDTTVTVDTGSGTILAGDVVTIGNYKYVVKTALSGGSFVIGAPGIREVVADNTAITVNATHASNIALHRSALEVAMRAPALPAGGDAASDMMYVQDPVSGLAFTIAHYKGYKKAMIEVAAVWGVKAWNDKFIQVLMG